MAAMFIGRGVRFALEGWMAVSYGEQAKDIFKQHYPKIGLSIAVAILIIFLLNNLHRRRNLNDELEAPGAK
jgi:hypothetical protein